MDDVYQRLFATVMAEPESDEPRLVLADYLEEHGDPRAEFIRVQCELASVDRRSREFYQLQERSDQLLTEHDAAWLKSLPKCVRKPVFRRGFVSEATITAKQLLKEPEALHAGPYEWVRPNRLMDTGEAVAELPQWATVHGLDLSDLVVPDPDLHALLSSPNLTALEHLNLNHIRSSMNGALAGILAGAAFRPALRSLKCCHAFEDDFMPTFTKGAGFPELRSLTLGLEHRPMSNQKLGRLKTPKLDCLVLRASEFDTQGLKDVAALPLHRVRQLDLRGVALDDAAIDGLVGAEAFDDVTELDVSNHVITLDGVRSILARRVSRCEKLRLYNTRELAETGMAQVMDALAGTEFENLDFLELSFLREEGLVSRLLSGGSFQSLRSLVIHEVTIGKEDMEALCRPPLNASLRHLALAGVQLRDDAFEAFGELPELIVLDLSAGHHRWEFPLRLSESLLIDAFESGRMRSLHELRLDETRLTERTLEAIANCEYLPELRVLSFSGNRATDTAVHALMESEHLPKLKLLDLRGSKGMKNRPKLRKQYGEERLRV